MNILLLGSGGREHALANAISKSPSCSKLWIAPGNAGTSTCGRNVAISSTDFSAVASFCVENEVQLVVVGPEEPLVKGITDFFSADDRLSQIPVIGPTAAGARLEGSKDFAKSFMLRHGIPTAAYGSFTAASLSAGYDFLTTLHPPYVLKADGLAAGKGVLILDRLEDAKQELEAMLQHAKFGAASSTVVIEEFLHGIELSVFVLTDGEHYKILPAAKDYKRIGEGDQGLNTGGMGAVSPVPFADADFMKTVEQRIVRPTVEGLKKDGIGYRGWIFIGLMNVDGNPKVIEYNVRMGDPETEVVFPRIQSDVVELLSATGNGTLDQHELRIDPRTALTVMMVSGGYPEEYEKGKVITGLDRVSGSMVFHAGTSTDKDGNIITNGGRVLAVTSLGADLAEAQATSYASIREIAFDGSYFRRDIGKDLE
jgi:phosphoribosylamine--glycine ligase